MLPEGLWFALLVSMALGAARGGSGLSELYLYSSQYYLSTISVSREAHTSWATIITERDGYSYLSIPRYLGRALVAR